MGLLRGSQGSRSFPIQTKEECTVPSPPTPAQSPLRSISASESQRQEPWRATGPTCPRCGSHRPSRLGKWSWVRLGREQVEVTSRPLPASPSLPLSWCWTTMRSWILHVSKLVEQQWGIEGAGESALQPACSVQDLQALVTKSQAFCCSKTAHLCQN